MSGVNAPDGSTILFDHSNIGTDASGQGNHFHDENFAAGNTGFRYSSTFVSDHANGFRDGEEGVNAFDGYVGSGTGASASRARAEENGIITWDVSSYNLSGVLEVKSATDRNVIVDGVLYDPGTMDAGGEWKTITTVSNPSTIIFTGNNGTLNDGGTSGAIVYGIKVDDELLH